MPTHIVPNLKVPPSPSPQIALVTPKNGHLSIPTPPLTLVPSISMKYMS